MTFPSSHPYIPEPDTPDGSTFQTRWWELISTRHTPSQWAIITDAITIADTATTNPLGDPLVRGGEDWCRIAFTAMEAPASAARAQEIPDRSTDRCLIDPDVLRVWLGAPGPYPDPSSGIVADRLSPELWQSEQDYQQMVVDSAQDAGLYGVEGHWIRVYGVAGDDGLAADRLVILQPAHGPGLASELIIGGFGHSDSMSEVDNVVYLLSAVAREAAAILELRATSAEPGGTDRDRSPGRAFPAPSLDPAAPAGLPAGGPGLAPVPVDPPQRHPR